MHNSIYTVVTVLSEFPIIVNCGVCREPAKGSDDVQCDQPRSHKRQQTRQPPYWTSRRPVAFINAEVTNHQYIAIPTSTPQERMDCYIETIRKTINASARTTARVRAGQNQLLGRRVGLVSPRPKIVLSHAMPCHAYSLIVPARCRLPHGFYAHKGMRSSQGLSLVSCSCSCRR